MGTVDPGLIVISGRVNEGISLETAEEEVEKVIGDVRDKDLGDDELNKVKNQAESILEFGEVEVINRAMNLAFAKLSGDANLVNTEANRIERVTKVDINRLSNEVLKEANANVLYYHSIMN